MNCAFRRFVAAYCLISPLVAAASFDCAKARTRTEKLICSDAALSKADERMADAYENAFALAGQSSPQDAEALKLDQRAWLEERTASSTGTAPLLNAYKKRLDFLDYYITNASASDVRMTGTYEYRKTNFCTNCEPGKKSGVTQTGTLEINRISDGAARISLSIRNTARGEVGSLDGRASIKAGVITYAGDSASPCNLTIRFSKAAAIVTQGDSDCGFRMGTDASATYIKKSDSISPATRSTP